MRHVADEPRKPLLVSVFEAAAEAMELGQGEQTLELVFSDGHLRRWYTRTGSNGAHALERFDEAAGIAVAQRLL